MLTNFSRRFKKDYRKSPEKIRQKFEQRLSLFLSDSYARMLNNHVLTGKWMGYKSINVTGDWRAIFVEVETDNVIFVAIGTHSQLYG